MLLEDITDYLSSGGVGTVGTDIFASMMPDNPDDCVAVYETGGFPSTHVMGSAAKSVAAEEPTILVRCRGTTYSTARVLMHRVEQLLDGMRTRTINGVEYLWAEGMQPPIALGVDLNEREIVSCNYRIMRAAATSS
jgi:hypothetical protein